jgi:hypothetical protein
LWTRSMSSAPRSSDGRMPVACAPSSPQHIRSERAPLPSSPRAAGYPTGLRGNDRPPRRVHRSRPPLLPLHPARALRRTRYRLHVASSVRSGRRQTSHRERHPRDGARRGCASWRPHELSA